MDKGKIYCMCYEALFKDTKELNIGDIFIKNIILFGTLDNKRRFAVVPDRLNQSDLTVNTLKKEGQRLFIKSFINASGGYFIRGLPPSNAPPGASW